MSTLSEAKKQLQFNQDFISLVDILKGIAASQFQTLMRKRKRFDKFAESFEGFFELLDLARVDSPFVASRSEVTGVVMVTSDEGFMGGLNARVIHAGLTAAGNGPKALIVLGGRGADALKDLHLEHTAFPGVSHEQAYDRAVQVKEHLVELTARGAIGRLLLVYPYPVSLMVQRPEVVHLLPCGELFQRLEPPLSAKRTVLLESAPDMIIQYLVGIWISYRLCDIFEESRLAEFAARTTHLEQSHDRLTEQGKVLRYRYFRCRRERIDKGMRETFASILLRRGG